MKQEDKELLLKDLCSRLPYGVKLFSKYVDGLDTKEVVGHLSQIDDSMVLGITNEPNDEYSFTYVAIHEVKPYLFPMSSMTEWQERELEILMKNSIESCGMLSPYDCLEMERFFNENHIDWRGLIPKGLAIDATGLGVY